jgi:hypothetical protein
MYESTIRPNKKLASPDGSYVILLEILGGGDYEPDGRDPQARGSRPRARNI